MLRYPAARSEATSVGAGLLLGALVLGAMMSSASSTLLVVAFAAVGFAAVVVLTRQVRRPLLALLFFTAPIEINKAVLTSVVSRYYPAGPYYSPGLYLSAAHMVLLALTVAWLGRRLLLQRRLPPLTGLDALALAFVAFVWLRSIGSPQGALAVASAAAYTLAILAFYVVSHTIQDESDLRLVMVASATALMLTVLYAFLQMLARSQLELPGIKPVAAGANIDFGGNGRAFRPPGFMGHPNALAHYLVIVLPPLVAWVLMGPGRLAARLWWRAFAIAGAAGAALLITLSRGGWLSACVAVLFIVAVYFRRGVITPRQLGLLAGAALVCTVAVIAAYPNILLRLTAPDSRSLESRVLLADMAMTMIRDHPWIGVGFGNYNRAAYAYAPPLFATVSADYQLALHQLVVHNHYLLLAAELGIPATLLFAYLLWRFARLAWPLERWASPYEAALAVGLCAAIVGQAVFFNSDNYYADIRVYMFWLYAGALQALSLKAKGRGRA